jgi:hypothetical protein
MPHLRLHGSHTDGGRNTVIPTLVFAAFMSDFITFVIGVQNVGIGAEQNPLMAAGFGMGLGGVLLMKVFLCAVALAGLRRIPQRLPRIGAASLVIGLTLVGTAGNVVNGIL